MPRPKQRATTHADDHANDETSPSVIAKWSRLTPDARNVLTRVAGREPLAANLRKARENRGLSQAAVAKRLRLSRSLVAQIELGNRPVTADELAKFAATAGLTLQEFREEFEYLVQYEPPPLAIDPQRKGFVEAI